MARGEARETLDRRRAKHAWEQIDALDGSLDKICARAQGLPVEVRIQGLTVAVATLIKEGRSESRALAKWLAEWLLETSKLIENSSQRVSPMRLLEHATVCERDEYLALQTEALAYLEHVKRLLSALKKGGR